MTTIPNHGGRMLAEAADRFERLARGVKDQQLSETRSGPRVALSDAFVASPEEAWAKKFMTQAIGPASTSLQTVVVPGLAPVAMVGMPVTAANAASVELGPVGMERPRATGDLGPAIGAGLGKTARKRSWLGWLFLGI